MRTIFSSSLVLALAVSTTACGHASDSAPPLADDVSAGGLTVVATDQIRPHSVVLDATNLYWVTSGNQLAADGTVMKAPLPGGPATALASGQAFPWGFAIDSTWAYWTNYEGGTLMKVPLAGGPPVLLASGLVYPAPVAVDSTHIYWATTMPFDGQDAGIADGGKLSRVALDGGTPEVIATEQFSCTGLAVDDVNVYWITQALGAPKASLRKMPKSGGPIVELVADLEFAHTLLVADSALYWAEGDSLSAKVLGPAIRTVGKNGGTPTTILSGAFGAGGLALDGNTIYFTAIEYPPTTAFIGRVPKAGGTFEKVGNAGWNPGGLAVDGTNAYWADTVPEGYIAKMPK